MLTSPHLDPMQERPSELRSALSTCRSAFICVAITSGVVNVLYLTGSFYMLEVYDRVITSRSVPTLIGLSILALLLYCFQGILDVLRARILVRIGGALQRSVSPRTFDAMVRLPLKANLSMDPLQPPRDLEQVRSFLAGPGLTALFDLPWMPIYVVICFMFHVLLGISALVGAALLVALTIITDVFTRRLTKAAVGVASSTNVLALTCRRNAEVLQAMGMRKRMGEIWSEAHGRHMVLQGRISDLSGGMGGVSKVLRMVLQSAVLGMGAYLVIQQQATGGIIIASSILVARALAPIELAIAHWKAFVSAQQSWRRLSELLTRLPAERDFITLPRPKLSLSVDQVSAMPPGASRPIVQDVTFTLRAGVALGVIGPSASGKSSLIRTLVGVWEPVRGKVRMDGAALNQWQPEALGRHIGYLPQDVELFSGSVAENISRFEEDPDHHAILSAAHAAGVHELILQLPDGYKTQIGEGGAALSAGQRQRIGLARALYNDPFLVVLDEPNSNLDAAGDEALTQAILSVRARGGILIVVAHRPSALSGVDYLMYLANGRVQMIGTTDEVLNKILVKPPDRGSAIPRPSDRSQQDPAAVLVAEAPAAS